MNTTRQAAVAGLFYPADTNELRLMIQAYLDSVESSSHPPKAIIVPHAGYLYSGDIAASAYGMFKPMRNIINKVVLLGPSHRVPFVGMAASSADYFQTPLGQIRIDKASLEKIKVVPSVRTMDEAHRKEHSLEVHLPFLQELLDSFELTPLVVGDSKPQDVAQVLDILWGGEETLIVISSDLSHYHDYKTARQLDNATSVAIENLQLENINYDHACGRNPIQGLLYLAKKKGLHAKTIDLRNSGDTAGPRDNVVGYGAYVFQ